MRSAVQQRSVSTRFNAAKFDGVWLVALGAAFWGMDSVLRAPLLSTFTSAQIVFLEHILLALYAVPVLWLNRAQLAGLTLKQWGAVLFISWGGSGLATTMFTAAFQYGNLNVVLLLQKLQPLFVFVLARIILKEFLPRSFKWDLAVAVLGTYLLTFGFKQPLAFFADGKLIGSLLAIGAAVLWGGSTVMGRLLLDKMGFETVTAVRFLFALPFMGLLVALSHTNWTQMFIHAVEPKSFLLILLQALLPGVLSLLLYYKGLSGTKASYATLAELAFPATGVTLNWLLMGETFSVGQFVGFTLIWLVVYHISSYQNKTVTAVQ